MLCFILETMICNIVPDIIMKNDCLRLPLRVLKFKVNPHFLSVVGFVDVMIPCEFGRSYIRGYLLEANSIQIQNIFKGTLCVSEISILKESQELTDSVHMRWPCWCWWVTKLLGAPQDESRIGCQRLSETSTQDACSNHNALVWHIVCCSSAATKPLFQTNCFRTFVIQEKGSFSKIKVIKEPPSFRSY